MAVTFARSADKAIRVGVNDRTRTWKLVRAFPYTFNEE